MAKIDQFTNGEGGLSVRTKLNEAMKTVEVTSGYFTGDGTVATPLVGHWSGDTTSITYTGYLQLSGVSAPSPIVGRLYSGVDGHLYYSSGSTFIQIDNPGVDWGNVSSDIIPDTTSTYTIGSTTKLFSIVYTPKIKYESTGTLIQAFGSNNYFIGRGGNVTLTGTDNIVIGYYAGNNLTLATHNIVIGYYAGNDITEADNNILIGRLAGDIINTGGDNVIIGAYAGRKLTTDIGAVMVGHEAGSYASGRNDFFGYQSGKGVDGQSTGSNNASFGYRSLLNFTTGVQNAAFGGYSLSSITTGNYNTAIGYQTSYLLSGGSYNTLLGYKAGYESLVGSNNIFIGANAGYNETGTNKLYIHAQSTSSSDSNTSLIYGEFDNLFIKINGHLKLKAISEPTAENGLLYVNSTDSHLYYSSGTTYIKLSDNIINSDNLSNLQEGDMLSYDSTTGKFINVAAEEYDELIRISQTNISGNTQLNDYVSAGYAIDFCVIKETSGNSAGNVSLGLVQTGSTEIIDNFSVTANYNGEIPLGQLYFSDTVNTDLYISSDNWGTGKINIYLLLKRII